MIVGMLGYIVHCMASLGFGSTSSYLILARVLGNAGFPSQMVVLPIDNGI